MDAFHAIAGHQFKTIYGNDCVQCLEPCQCEIIAKIRVDEQAKTTRTAIAETLAYLADGGTGTWDCETLARWAKDVSEQPPTYVCCPFCAEVECDDDCPMRHVRE